MSSNTRFSPTNTRSDFNMFFDYVEGHTIIKKIIYSDSDYITILLGRCVLSLFSLKLAHLIGS
ncbi:MAG: hypothetical protein ACKPGB_27710, partial [Dolichospermum sp.]